MATSANGGRAEALRSRGPCHLRYLRNLRFPEVGVIIDDVLEFGQPPRDDDQASRVDYIGPFEHHKVVVDGWEVPLVAANPMPGGKVELVLDDRYGLDLSLADAERVVPFLAHAISVALGYASHPSDDSGPLLSGTRRPRRLRRLDSGEAEEPHGVPGN